MLSKITVQKVIDYHHCIRKWIKYNSSLMNYYIWFVWWMNEWIHPNSDLNKKLSRKSLKTTFLVQCERSISIHFTCSSHIRTTVYKEFPLPRSFFSSFRVFYCRAKFCDTITLTYIQTNNQIGIWMTEVWNDLIFNGSRVNNC